MRPVFRFALLVVAAAPASILLPADKGVESARRGEPEERPVFSGIRGPQLGWVFDRASRTLRPILGLPGAARLGPPLRLGVEVVEAAVAPGHDLILAVAEDGRVFAVRTRPEIAIEETDAGRFPDRIAFSPRGERAALLYRSARTAEIVRFGAKASREAAVDVSSIGGEITALAVSDGGEVLAAGSGGVWRFAPDAQLVGHGENVSAIAYAPGTTDAAVTDVSENAVHLLSGSAFSTLAGPESGISEPVAVAWDGNRILVANAKAGSITALARTGEIAGTAECNCVPAALEPMSEPAVFRVSGEGSLLVFEDKPGGGRFWFVPAGGSDPTEVAR